MPEVFENNPHPRIKISPETKEEILNMYNEQHKSCAEIYHYFNEQFSRTRINDICHQRK